MPGVAGWGVAGAAQRDLTASVAVLGGKIKPPYICLVAIPERYTSAPTLADIEAIAAEAFATIPAELARHVSDVVIHVVDFADDETLDAFEFDSPFDLLGLYQGVSLDQKSVAATPSDVDHIYLYRRPLLDYWCDSGEDLYHVVRHVLIHEIGHHFGFSDEDMDAIEAAADD